MGILSWIVVGLIAGWLTGMVMRGRGYGIVGDVIIGIVGGLIGGFLAGALFHVRHPYTGISLESIIIAFIGGVILTAILHAIARPAATV